ncbi:MAG: hypothetical protein NVS3B20_15790 [Polyangiales bacterium]
MERDQFDTDEPATHLLTRPQVLQLASLELLVVAGPDRSVRLALAPGLVRIGTAPSSHLRLTDPTVSRLHCELTVQPDGISIVDCASKNKTIINDVAIQEAELTAGARLCLGATELRLEQGSRPVFMELSPREGFGPVIGRSPEMRRLYAIMERVAPTESTVLLLGETGTGKELVARALHEASKRAKGPFVTVDCSAIAENLVESELFGHVRGAFSGAAGDRKGLFEEANGGTLFLDEVGELPVAMQPKLLRVLEARQVRLVGGNTVRPVDVRVIAATNRSLASRVNEGAFREDLYYRLAVVELQLPPLRSRREDIPLLASHFHACFTGVEGGLPPALLPSLLMRSWPGNIRELRNAIERAVSVGDMLEGVSPSPVEQMFQSQNIAARMPVHLPFKEARVAWTEQFEKLYLTELLQRTGGNISRAAALAGIHRRSLQRLIASLGLRVAGKAPTDDDP